MIAYALMVRMGPMNSARADTNTYLTSMVEDVRTDEQKRADLKAALRTRQGKR